MGIDYYRWMCKASLGPPLILFAPNLDHVGCTLSLQLLCTTTKERIFQINGIFHLYSQNIILHKDDGNTITPFNIDGTKKT